MKDKPTEEKLKSLECSSLFDSKITEQGFAKLDLSAGNPHAEGLYLAELEVMKVFIADEIKRKNSVFGYGGYQEKRIWYFRNQSFAEPGKERIYHIGVDLWVPAGTDLYCPYEGVVHSFQDNAALGDYGPTIILRHETPEGMIFHTLYGHLSRESLVGLQKGKVFESRSLLGTIGDEDVNGNWPSHLHFQIIVDMMGMEGDFAGVVSEEDLTPMSINCPDPELLLSATLS